MTKPYSAQLRSRYWESPITQVSATTFDAEVIITLNEEGLISHDWFKHYAIGIEFYTDAAATITSIPAYGRASIQIKTPVMPNTWRPLPGGEFPINNKLQQTDWAAITNQVRVQVYKMRLEAPYFRVRIVGMAA